MQPLELNAEFRYILDCLEKEHRHVFITGRAGTGKSTLLQLFRQTTAKKVAVVAPTGIAALNVKGQTIHSFFGFPPRLFDPGEIRKKKSHRLYKSLDALIIDEVSMVRADIFDHIDLFLRRNRENNRPFGGLQLILFGDLFQLPPVVSDQESPYFYARYPNPFFFAAAAFQSLDMDFVELSKVYRQDNIHFLKLLDAIRLNRIDPEELEELNQRHLPKVREPAEGPYLTLSARNYSVDALNMKKLAELPGKPQLFQAGIYGQFDPRSYPTDQVLQLKVGAQVMFLKNDPEKKYVNGTIGEIIDLDQEEHILVRVSDRKGGTQTIEVQPHDWEIIRYKTDLSSGKLETEVLGSFTQYPLRLAWAITIHKSQGKTFDRVIIDMGGGAFERGQTYVALSRCRTLEGILLKHPIRFADIMIDETVVGFYESNFIG